MNGDGKYIEDGAKVEIDEAALIQEIQDDYTYSIGVASAFLDIAVDLRKEHDNSINEDAMPTRSKMSIPFKFAQVEQALADSHEYNWPPVSNAEVRPQSEDVTMEQVRNVERGLYHMIRDKMKCPKNCLRIERDCVKVGFGYGIIEPYRYQTLSPVTIAMAGADGKIKTSTEMDLTETEQSLRLRYLSPGQVIAYPDGCTPNGDSKSSIVHVWDFETERNFRNMVSEENLEGLDFDVANLNEQAIEQIILDSKSGVDDFAGDTFKYIKELGGIDFDAIIANDDNSQATIPILKVYREGEHVWLANGETIIYRQAARAQTFMCPVLKMSAVIDGMTWYPYSTSEAMRDVNFNRNVWLNLITDITTWSAKRPLLYSTMALDEAPEFGPDSVIGMDTLDVHGAAAFLQAPGLQSGDLQLGEILDKRAEEISGQKDFTQKNFSRGGQHAFNDLLNSANGRERIAGAVMETGFMDDLYTQVLVYMQINGIGYNGSVTTFDEEKGEKDMEFLSISSEDMAHSFSVSVSLDKKKYSTEFTTQERLAIYQEKKQDAGTDQYELNRFLYGNDDLTRRLTKSKKEVNQLQDEDRQDARAANQAQAAQGQAEPAGPAAPEAPVMGAAPDGNALEGLI